MGSPVLVTGKVSGAIGNVPGRFQKVPEDSGGVRVGNMPYRK